MTGIDTLGELRQTLHMDVKLSRFLPIQKSPSACLLEQIGLFALWPTGRPVGTLGFGDLSKQYRVRTVSISPSPSAVIQFVDQAASAETVEDSAILAFIKVAADLEIVKHCPVRSLVQYVPGADFDKSRDIAFFAQQFLCVPAREQVKTVVAD